MTKNVFEMEPQTNHIVLLEKYVIGVTKVVKTSRTREYTREL
jgi:hypothetical protein